MLDLEVLLNAVVEGKEDPNIIVEGMTLLMQLVQNGDHVGIVRLVKVKDLNINAQSQKNENQTALHMAAVSKKRACVEALLKHKDIDVNVRREDGNTALHVAIDEGAIACAKLLSDHPKMDGSIVNSREETVLHLVLEQEDLDLVKKVVAINGLDLDAVNQYGVTALLQATAKRSLPLYEILLNAGSDVNACGGDKKTPLYCAIEKDWEEGVQYLSKIPEINPNLLCSKGDGPLHRAVKNKRLRCLVFIMNIDSLDVNLETSDKSGGWTALYLAAENKDPEAIGLLMRSVSLDVNLQSAREGKTAVIEAVRRGSLGCLNRLVGSNARVDIVDSSGKSALDYANERVKRLKGEKGEKEAQACLECVKSQIERWNRLGVKSGLRNPQTVLKEAARDGSIYRIKKAACDAIVMREDKLGKTALDYAQEKLESEMGSEKEAEARQCVEFLTVFTNSKCASRAIKQAAKEGDILSIKAFIGYVDDVNETDIDGKSALDYAKERLHQVSGQDGEEEAQSCVDFLEKRKVEVFFMAAAAKKEGSLKDVNMFGGAIPEDGEVPGDGVEGTEVVVKTVDGDGTIVIPEDGRNRDSVLSNHEFC